MSSKGTSAPPETSSASCQAASSTKAARESCSARLCMRGGFAAATPGPPARTRACKVDQRRRTETARLRGGDDGGALGRRVDAGGARAAEPFGAVRAHAVDDRHERAALLGQRVLDARRDLGVRAALEDALLLQRAQPQRQRARGDAAERALELTEPRTALREVAHDQERPLPADDVGGTADGAVRIGHLPAFY